MAVVVNKCVHRLLSPFDSRRRDCDWNCTVSTERPTPENAKFGTSAFSLLSLNSSQYMSRDMTKPTK